MNRIAAAPARDLRTWTLTPGTVADRFSLVAQGSSTGAAIVGLRRVVLLREAGEVDGIRQVTVVPGVRGARVVRAHLWQVVARPDGSLARRLVASGEVILGRRYPRPGTTLRGGRGLDLDARLPGSRLPQGLIHPALLDAWNSPIVLDGWQNLVVPGWPAGATVRPRAILWTRLHGPTPRVGRVHLTVALAGRPAPRVIGVRVQIHGARGRLWADMKVLGDVQDPTVCS